MKNCILLFLLFLNTSFITSAQVGVNETTPSQMLDVNGKIEINDDASPASEGAIRYDSSAKDFEGYDGTNWNSFTMSQGALPTGAIPCYSKLTISTDGVFNDMTIREMAANNNPITTIPAGKYFIVTGASFSGPLSGASVGTNYTIRICGSFNLNDEVIWVQGRFENGLQSTFNNGYIPLIILRPGEKLQAQHPNFVDDNSSVSVYVRGWLVDDLNY